MFVPSTQQLNAVQKLCRAQHVRRLDLFGSATGPEFDAQRSDLDFFVEIEELPPAEYADAYFTMRESLARLFDRPVDLVTPSAARNPYFAESIARTRRPLYAA